MKTLFIAFILLIFVSVSQAAPVRVWFTLQGLTYGMSYYLEPQLVDPVGGLFVYDGVFFDSPESGRFSRVLSLDWDTDYPTDLFIYLECIDRDQLLDLAVFDRSGVVLDGVQTYSIVGEGSIIQCSVIVEPVSNPVPSETLVQTLIDLGSVSIGLGLFCLFIFPFERVA